MKFGKWLNHLHDFFFFFYTIEQTLSSYISVHGGWSEYGEWSECTGDCGGGTQTQTRTCTKPEPQHGGDECVGEEDNTQSCNEQPCPSNIVSVNTFS